MAVVVVTGSADKTCKILDIVKGFKTVGTLKATDAVFEIELIFNLTIAGCGDGNIVAFDNDTQECLYG